MSENKELYLNFDEYIRQLYPTSPRHPRQKYLLTAKGITLYLELMKGA